MKVALPAKVSNSEQIHRCRQCFNRCVGNPKMDPGCTVGDSETEISIELGVPAADG
jgi:hypothetical protein